MLLWLEKYLSQYRWLKWLIVIIVLGFGIPFLPFIIGGVIVWLAYHTALAKKVKYSLIVLILIPTLLMGAAWTFGFYGSQRQSTETTSSPIMSPPSSTTPTVTPEAFAPIASPSLALKKVTTPTPSSTSLGSAGNATDSPIKLSENMICHPPNGAYYDQTLNYTPFSTMQKCIDAGGKPSKR